MTNPPTPPVSPNYNANSGARLVTDRFDFAGHVDGYDFRHEGANIDLIPPIPFGLITLNDVHTAIAALAGSAVVPVVPDATTSTKGIIKLAGDLGGTGTSASAPVVSGLQGRSVSTSAPSDGQVLTWSAILNTWRPFAGAVATTSAAGIIQLSAGVVATQGDVGGVYNNTRVIGLQGFAVAGTTPGTNQVLTWNGTAWAPAAAGGTPNATTSSVGTVQLAGDLGGAGTTATSPKVGGINGATVPAAGSLTTGNVLQVSGGSALSYGFIADANVSVSAAIQGTKISPNFGTQSLTAGVTSLGTTNTGTLTAGTTTSFNTLNGAFQVTTRTVSSSFAVDTTTADYVIFVNTGTTVSITLPLPTNGRRLIIKDITGSAATNNITLIPHSAEKIEGVAVNKALGSNWGSWTVISNGTDWFLI